MVGNQAHHRVVDRLCAEGAAHGEHKGLIVAHAELGTADGSVGTQHFAAHGKPRDDRRVFRVHQRSGFFHTEHHKVHTLGQRLVRDAGIGVLLVNRGGDAHFCRHAHHRTADIAAEADDRVGRKGAQDLFCLRRGAQNFEQRGDVTLDVFECQLTVEPVDVDR